MTAPTLTHANGVTRPAPPLSLPLQLPLPKGGPVSLWPRTVVPVPPAGARLLPLVATPRQDPPPAATPARRVRWRPRFRAIDADMVITWSMAATVAVVAIAAAIISYSHIYDLATGQRGSGTETGIQPVLLPLSIDGVIAEASLVLLYAARHKIPAPGLARFMLWLGITATVAANVAHGLPPSVLSPQVHDVIGALLSAWPAAALIGSMEMAMRLVRDVRTVADGGTPARPQRTGWRQRRRDRKAVAAGASMTPPAGDATASSTPASATPPTPPPGRQDAVPAPATPAAANGRQPSRKRQTPAARQPKADGGKLAAAKALLDDEPALSVSDLMAAGVSEGTARRAKKEQDGLASP